MKPHLRIGLQELGHGFGFVRRQIVENDVNFSSPFRAGDNFSEEVNELRTGVSRRCLAHNLPCPHLQGRVQREFLIHAEHSRMLRRLRVQRDDVCDLFLELWIIAGHVTIQPVWLRSRLPPDPLHRRLAQSQRSRHLATGPVRAAICGAVRCLAQHSRLYRRGGHTRRTSLMPRIQPRHPMLFEAPLPARNRWPRSMQFAFDLIPTLPVGQCQHQARSEDITRRQCSRLRPASQFFAMLLAQFGHSMIASHIIVTTETSIGNEMTGTVHLVSRASVMHFYDWPILCGCLVYSPWPLRKYRY